VEVSYRGAMPLQGFFQKERQLMKETDLEQDGFDTSIRNPGGWSTLGWFTDPILSNMLKRNEGDLASLIIHEMVHATVFVKDDVNFNENLASFVGDTAAYYFLASHFGRDSEQFIQYLQEDQDYRIYSKHILRGTQALDSLYKSFESAESLKPKDKERNDDSADYDFGRYTLPIQLRENLQANRMPNNTYFMSYHLYQARQDNFNKELDIEFSGDLKAYIKHLTGKYPFL
jgi:predicted aminopeptidase